MGTTLAKKCARGPSGGGSPTRGALQAPKRPNLEALHVQYKAGGVPGRARGGRPHPPPHPKPPARASTDSFGWERPGSEPAAVPGGARERGFERGGSVERRSRVRGRASGSMPGSPLAMSSSVSSRAYRVSRASRTSCASATPQPPTRPKIGLLSSMVRCTRLSAQLSERILPHGQSLNELPSNRLPPDRLSSDASERFSTRKQSSGTT